MTQKTILTWQDFETWMGIIIPRIRRRWPEVKVVFGPPRGGLCPAVALSHRLGIPLAVDRVALLDLVLKMDLKPENILWVDEIVDTGKELRRFLPLYQDVHTCSWVIKRQSMGHFPDHDFHIPMEDDVWVVFPWESQDENNIQQEIANARSV